MKDALRGWPEIAAYLGLHPRTAQRYELTRGLPVHRTPGGGLKPPVYAFKEELDEWQGAKQSEAPVQSAELAGPVLSRIVGMGQGTKLFRRNYVLRFDLKRSGKGVRAHVECEFELCNATDKQQSFVQELTVDDSDQGWVERMSFSANERTVYDLKRPRAVQRPIGYSVYRGPKQTIAPQARGILHACRASWVIHRAENDIWYNHMVLPTVGMRVETHAPESFEITPSYSMQGLIMTAEHTDIAWRKRP